MSLEFSGFGVLSIMLLSLESYRIAMVFIVYMLLTPLFLVTFIFILWRPKMN